MNKRLLAVLVLHFLHRSPCMAQTMDFLNGSPTLSTQMGVAQQRLDQLRQTVPVKPGTSVQTLGPAAPVAPPLP